MYLSNDFERPRLEEKYFYLRYSVSVLNTHI